MKIESEQIVLAVLQNPREKLWGILREINPSGIYLRGIDVNSFEEMVNAVSNHESFYGINDQFIPMWRVERVTIDEDLGDIPSMQSQFKQRTGSEFAEH